MKASEKYLWEGVSATFAFLAQVANNAPDEASVRELLEAVRAADENEGAYGYRTMKRYAHACVGRELAEVTRELGVDWTAIFRGMNRKSSLKPPYAGVWLSSDGVGVEEMCAVNACYTEAGLGAGATVANRHDYFGIELEFVGRLAQRIADGDAAAADQLALFLDRHLLSWFGSFANDVETKDAISFWKGYLDLIEASLQDVRALLSERP